MVLCSRHRFFRCFGCVAAGGGADYGSCVRDTEFSVVLGVSLLSAVRITGFCARDTGFSAVLGVSLRVAVRIACLSARDTEFSAVLGVSLHGRVGCWQEMAVKMLPGCQFGCMDAVRVRVP